MLTVHVEQKTVDKIHQSAADMPWTQVPFDFENYFSTAKRPYIAQRAIDSQACIAIIDFDENPELALETAECLRQSFDHKVAIVALSSATDPDLLLRAMRAGYSEFLGKPFDYDEFMDTLSRLESRWSVSIARPQNSGKVLSFFGAKGGVGTTTLAVHLAMFLVRDFRKKVLLIDNHPQLGHACLYLGLDGSHNHFYELVRNVSRLDLDLLRGFIATHPSGLDALSSPDVYGGARNTDTESVERTLEFLSHRNTISFCWIAKRRSKTSILPSLICRTGCIWSLLRKSAPSATCPAMWTVLFRMSRRRRSCRWSSTATPRAKQSPSSRSRRRSACPIAIKITNNYSELGPVHQYRANQCRRTASRIFPCS